MANININKTCTYIYEMPYKQRKELCSIIDINDKWEELGGKFMNFDCPSLYRFSKAHERSRSPTDELLTSWGEQNHTILELFIILNEMQHYQAMTILKPFVDPKYHKLIFQGVKSFSNLVKTGSNSHNAIANHIISNTGSSAKGNNNLEHEDLSKSSKINERIFSDPSLMLSSAEACTPLITYSELEHATNFWNKSNILGKGGFGVVFKGIWKNTAVAIKRLESQKEAEQQFNILEAQRQQSLRELKYLNSCRHDNILSLYGFSIGGEKPCLVYQYMINGSLEDRLLCRQGTKPLTWNIRFKIATGSARGLQFLHGMDKPLIHGDIKSANILLDPYFEPRIGDFGLAREGPLQEYTHVKVSHVHGTRPYLPDEFLRGKKFSTKVDTYSFGVVLFEIATGLRAYDSLRDLKFLKDHVENYPHTRISDLADAKAGSDENNVYLSLIFIGKDCVSHKPKDRPGMEQVLRKLDCIMLQERQHSTIRHSFIPTNQFEQMKRLSTPSGSYHLQPWLFSPVPSKQLLKQNTSPVPYFGVATVPDQIEGAIMPPIEENNCLLKTTIEPNSTGTPCVLSSTYEPPSVSQNTNNNNNNDSNSTPQILESKAQGIVEKKNNTWKNSISGEDNGLPLISELRMQSTDSS